MQLVFLYSTIYHTSFRPIVFRAWGVEHLNPINYCDLLCGITSFWLMFRAVCFDEFISVTTSVSKINSL